MEQSILKDRDRSPRRCNGAKTMLKSWAKGDISTVGMWRLCYAIVTKDGTDAGAGMARLAGLATSESRGREQHCSRKIKELLAAAALPTMIRKIPDAGEDDTVTHTLPPTALIRLIHRHNRVKFGQIFGTDRAALKKFWQSLLSSDDGTEFQDLHPDLKDKTPEDLETSVPIIIHEDAAPFSKRKGVNVLQ